MFVRAVSPGILVIVFSILLVKCLAKDGTVMTNKDYWKNEIPLRCYDCNSQYDPRCGDPFDPYSIGMINCSERELPEHLRTNEDNPEWKLKPIVCRKIVQKVEKTKRVLRECGYIEDDRDDKACVTRVGTKDVHVTYCACTHSLCNAGINIRPSLFSVAFITFSMIYLFSRY